jgi:uncharacterized protein YjbI with pentapeptide repeats
LQAANLAGANLNRANLEGTNLQGANLAGARLTRAQLESANLGGANLAGAMLAHADFTGADLSTATVDDADLSSANLSGANLDEARLARAQMQDAQLKGASAKRTRFARSSLVNADLTAADLTGADLSECDLRRARLVGARLEETKVTGARIAGIVGTGAPVGAVNAEWVDASHENDGPSKRVTGNDVIALLSGAATAVGGSKRFFGKGDVLRNAALEFDAGASVEVESLFEGCTITLNDGTELVVGKNGVLSGCQIRGAGRLTIHGKFIEQKSPGIAGVTHLIVTAGGSLQGAVEQAPELTRFAFEPGCALRMKIKQASKGTAKGKGGRNS